MWSGSNQRIKALMAAREREKQRLSRPIHLMRADIRLSFRSTVGADVIVPARALLNEFSPNGICVYTYNPLTPNLEMTLDINYPQKFTIQARVTWSQYQPSSSHVLTTRAFAYRVGLSFRFTDDAQAEAFKKFCEEMKERYAQAVPGQSLPPLPGAPAVEPASSSSAAPVPVATEASAAAPAPAVSEPVPAPAAQTAASPTPSETPAADPAPAETPTAETPAPEATVTPIGAATPGQEQSVADVLSAIGDVGATEEKKAA